MMSESSPSRGVISNPIRQFLSTVRSHRELSLYGVGVLGVVVQALAMLTMALIGVWKLLFSTAGAPIEAILISGLFACFSGLLFWLAYQSITITSSTLGGLICCQILFIPICNSLWESSQYTLACLLGLTVFSTLFIIFLRKKYTIFYQETLG